MYVKKKKNDFWRCERHPNHDKRDDPNRGSDSNNDDNNTACV